MRIRLLKASLRISIKLLSFLGLIVFALFEFHARAESPQSEVPFRAFARISTPTASIREHDDSATNAGPSLNLEFLQIQGEMNASSRTSLRFSLNLAPKFTFENCVGRINDPIEARRCREQQIHEMAASVRFTSNLILDAGIIQVPQDGWSGYIHSSDDLLPVVNPFAPLDKSQPAFVLAKSFGSHAARIFITNDATTKFPGRGEFTNEQSQPTWIIEWKSLHCSKCGIIQLGNYDLNHSQFINLGLLMDSVTMSQIFDIGVDIRDRKYLHQHRKSYRWSIKSQTSIVVSSTQIIKIIGDAFRLDGRRLGEDRQIANSPGIIDQNERRLTLAYLQKLDASNLQWFIDFRGWQASFYKDYNRDNSEQRSAFQTGIGLNCTL